MKLSTFTPRDNTNFGDALPAKEAADRPLIVLVREHRTGIVTKYKPEGGDGVVADVADIATNEIWLDILWMNGAIVDNLAGFLGQAVAVKIVWTASKSGGNAYLTVQALEGPELGVAQQWAKANPDRFDTERRQRIQTPAPAPEPATTPVTTAPASTGQVTTAPASTGQVTTAPASTGQVDADALNDPQVQALLAQLQAQQQKT